MTLKYQSFYLSIVSLSLFSLSNESLASKKIDSQWGQDLKEKENQISTSKSRQGICNGKPYSLPIVISAPKAPTPQKDNTPLVKTVEEEKKTPSSPASITQKNKKEGKLTIPKKLSCAELKSLLDAEMKGTFSEKVEIGGLQASHSISYMSSNNIKNLLSTNPDAVAILDEISIPAINPSEKHNSLAGPYYLYDKIPGQKIRQSEFVITFSRNE